MDVEIGDVNDNAPKMEQKIIRANFRENISVQSKLLSIYATDADDMEGFGKLTYSIMGGSGVFDIDQTTGQLILSDELDYEMEKSYQVRFPTLFLFLIRLLSTRHITWKEILKRSLLLGVGGCRFDETS